MDHISKKRLKRETKIKNGKSPKKIKTECVTTCEVLSESEDVTEKLDPFTNHIQRELHPSLLKSVQADPPVVNTSTIRWPELGEIMVRLPMCAENKFPNKSESLLEDNVEYTQGNIVPKVYDLKETTPESMHVKQQIVKSLEGSTRFELSASDKLSEATFLTPFQNELFSIINNYQDLQYTKRTMKNAEDIRFIYCLHLVNHILKSRTKIIHHNAKLMDKSDIPEEYRDQGLVRPKVLILVPFKESAYKIVSLLEEILLKANEGNVINKKRFLEEYKNDVTMPIKNPKPEDFQLTFEGNTSEYFKIGISVTKKSLKLFTDFYSADIIIASPLGLRTVIGAEGETERDFDFLASIEVLILDQAEIFIMQNWDHVLHIFDHLHLQPKESHGTDFSRVRLWSLTGKAKLYRQTLIFSSLDLPEISSLFTKKCSNYEGRIKTVDYIEVGSISQVIVIMPHRFHKFSTNNVCESIDKRFDFFVNNILPDYKDSEMKNTLIFIPNYFDFVKLRNYFKKEFISFTQICEYSKPGKVAAARDRFYHGNSHFLLYTERYHFYNRIKLKGIHHLIFYGPPNFPHFYSEMCNLMQDAYINKVKVNTVNRCVSVIYSKYDVNQLSAVVGTKRLCKMLKSDQTVSVIITGETQNL